jgi:dethiobiotin synthetase
MNYFITAISTDSGKTLISAVLAQALKADYWKPIQAGFPTDTELVKTLTSNQVKTHREKYLLQTPVSPHAAAKIDQVKLSIKDFNLPNTSNSLIIEGAGGCLVPINDHEVIIDLVPHFNAEIILVSNNYLGSINHTLLTLEYLKMKNYPIKAIIFNGPANEETEDIIMKKCMAPCFFKVRELKSVNTQTILELSESFKNRWNELGW